MKTFALCLLATAASAVKITTQQDEQGDYCDPLLTAAEQIMGQADFADRDGVIGSEDELGRLQDAIKALADQHGAEISDEEIQEYLSYVAGEDGAIDVHELAWIMGDLLWVTEHLGDFYVGAGMIAAADADGSGSVSESESMDALDALVETVTLLGGEDGVDVDEVDDLIDTFYRLEQDGVVYSADIREVGEYLLSVSDAVDELAGGVLTEHELWEGVIGLSLADRDMDMDVDMDDIDALADMSQTIADAYDFDGDDEVSFGELYIAALDGEVDLANYDWLFEMCNEQDNSATN